VLNPYNVKTFQNHNGSSVIDLIISPRPSNSPHQRTVKSRDFNRIPSNHRIHQNRPRLTHYIEETNAGKGYIKELSFSQDGRIICSPFSYGVRLLAFNENCSELSTCVPNKTPVPLYEIGTSTAHNDIVLCTKFSPRHCMLVSGCHSGKIIWYQPYL
jgi:WD repeat-containing protein 32